MASAAPNIPEYAVSELAGAVRRTLEGAFGLVRVRGEISGWKLYGASGHGYFDLKDADACLAAVMWKTQVARLGFRAEDGLEVIATGRLSSYPKSSKYQLIVERMEVAGVGALLKQIEDRRRRLEAEGLFDPARKPGRPAIPFHIGIVTSPSGAVIRDILHRLADRFPRRVTLWPVPVQGPGAAPRIAAAIAGFNAMAGAARPDLLIVARGGGSIEDLMAFNEEEVVRAAAESAIPLISAVGHETDTTLLDFAAALRAPTPTAAAELAVPVRAELVDRVATLAIRAGAAGRRNRATARERLDGLGRRLPRPALLLGVPRQRLDEACHRLGRARTQRLEAAHGRLAAAAARLQPRLLAYGLAALRARLQHPRVTPSPALVAARFGAARQRLDAAARLAATLSPDAVLARGFALVTTPAGRLLSSAAAAAGEPDLMLRFHDGPLAARTGHRLVQGLLFQEEG